MNSTPARKNSSGTSPRRQGNQHQGTRSQSSSQPQRGGASRSAGARKSAGKGAPKSDPSRLVAFQVIRAVAVDDAYANLKLPAQLRRAGLSGRDARFATELTYGTLRGQGHYDPIIAQCLTRDFDDVEPAVLDCLRLGAHQLLAMRVSDHAAVNETVTLAQETCGARTGGFVNAILRKISQKTLPEWITELTATARSRDEELALQYSHPQWVVRSFAQSLRSHQREEELGELLAADNLAPEVHLVGLPGLPDDAGETQLQGAIEAGATSSDVLELAATYRGGDLHTLPGISAGSVRVQDIGSQWIARALAALPNRAVDSDPGPDPSQRWLDLCAGPGGKAALLTALAPERSATVVANEISEHRAALVSKALAPLPAESWELRVGDGREFQGSDERFARILLDAPCTGLGALRRRPEARWRRRAADLPVLLDLQRELLDAAVSVLATGGVLAYVTCSPHIAETVLQVEDLLKRHPQLRLLDATQALQAAALPGSETMLSSAGAETAAAPSVASQCVQLWPHIHGTDAMFCALITTDDAAYSQNTRSS